MLSMGHEVVWLERYEGLKVVLNPQVQFQFTIVSHVNTHPQDGGVILDEVSDDKKHKVMVGNGGQKCQQLKC